MNDVQSERVICPYCGYRMPLEFDATAECHGVHIRCKGKHCGKLFEIVIKNGVQYKRPYVFDMVLGLFKKVF